MKDEINFPLSFHSSLLRQLREHLSFEELRSLTFALNIDPENLSYTNKSDVARELIAILNRQGRLSELHDALNEINPNIAWNLTTTNKDQLDMIAVLVELYEEGERNGGSIEEIVISGDSNSITLAEARQDIVELQDALQNQADLPPSIQNQLKDLEKNVKQALARSEEITNQLTAEFVPPSGDQRKIRLIAEHDANRLEEYSSDENIAYLLIGLFAGAIIGIITTWATSDPPKLTPTANFALAIFSFLTALSIFWAYRIRGRVQSVKKSYLI